MRAEKVVHFETLLLFIQNIGTGKNVEMFGGRGEGEFDVLGNVPHGRRVLLFEEGDNGKSSSIRNRFKHTFIFFHDTIQYTLIC